MVGRLIDVENRGGDLNPFLTCLFACDHRRYFSPCPYYWLLDKAFVHFLNDPPQ